MTASDGHLCRGHVWHSGSLDDMARVLAPEVNLFNCERAVPSTALDALDALSNTSPFVLDCSEGRPEHLAEKICLALTCDPALAQWMANDIAELHERFRSIYGETARVLLEGAGTQTCTLLHVDGLPLRLLTTYLGPGTVWVVNEGVVRANLGKQDNVAVCPDPSLLRSAKRFAVLVMKGGPSKEDQASGLVHRSPHMEHGMRIVLRIDPHLR